MWHIGQLLQNKQGKRVLYAGFDFDKKPCHAFLQRKGNELELMRDEMTSYTHLPALEAGDPIRIGTFALMLNGGFFGELDPKKLRASNLYKVALETLR